MDEALTTPRQAGFRMPAEWEPHQACWMWWPWSDPVWQPGLDGGDGLAAARTAYAAVARAIAEFEPVRLISRAEDAGNAHDYCGDAVDIITLPVDDAWARDTGPSFLLGPNGETAGVDWQFNNYGNEAFAGKPALTPEQFANDRLLARRLLEHLGLRRFSAPLVMEGGAFHVDGDGTVLTTEECLLHPNRNPGMSRSRIEALLLEYTGSEKVIWLGRGLVDDETNGHVDELACFVRPGVVLALSKDDPADPDYAAVQDNLTRLASATDARGRSLEVVKIQAAPSVWYRGVRLSLSYVNLYIANDGIVMPSFDAPEHDAAAAAVLASVFPERKIVQVPALDIFTGGGGIHCITQQQPRGG
ncbi:MAG: agmatine deiminase family protein [Gammaproteobacteria bacterium]